jgi:hypothetical protein
MEHKEERWLTGMKKQQTINCMDKEGRCGKLRKKHLHEIKTKRGMEI